VRYCDNPPPMNGGAKCNGTWLEVDVCYSSNNSECSLFDTSSIVLGSSIDLPSPLLYLYYNYFKMSKAKSLTLELNTNYTFECSNLIAKSILNYFNRQKLKFKWIHNGNLIKNSNSNKYQLNNISFNHSGVVLCLVDLLDLKMNKTFVIEVFTLSKYLKNQKNKWFPFFNLFKNFIFV
jgi:hypothetical protein